MATSDVDDHDAAHVDWSQLDGTREYTCTCAICEHVFRSHAKVVLRVRMPALFLSRKPCPSCGAHDLRRASSDPESMTIGAPERTKP